jgi:hypothetical protein
MLEQVHVESANPARSFYREIKGANRARKGNTPPMDRRVKSVLMDTMIHMDMVRAVHSALLGTKERTTKVYRQPGDTSARLVPEESTAPISTVFSARMAILQPTNLHQHVLRANLGSSGSATAVATTQIALGIVRLAAMQIGLGQTRRRNVEGDVLRASSASQEKRRAVNAKR